MKHMAGNMGVDLLLIDTGRFPRSNGKSLAMTFSTSGDLHDGNGLSDAALPDGTDSNPIFGEVGFDLLTIGEMSCLYRVKAV
jgi:hypothetical protein